MTATVMLKRALGVVATLAPKARPRRVVLLYHGVGASPWAVPAADFRRQMEWLGEHAVLKSVSELVAAEDDAPLQVAVTFDDGYGSVRDAALPVLSDIGARPSIYINTGWIDSVSRRKSDPALGHYPDEQFLSWPELELLADSGWTIGSHGVDHLDLTREAAHEAQSQLERSKAAIETTLGRPCEEFAYTWGRSTATLRQLVAAAGYERAMGGRHAPLGPDTAAMNIPRMNVAREYGFDDFRAIVRGDWDYLGVIQDLRSARR